MKNMERIKYFENYLKGKRQGLNTRIGNMNTVENYLKWLDKENVNYLEILHTDILAYMGNCKEKGNKKITINRKLLSIRYFYEYLQSEKLLDINLFLKIKVRGIIKRHPKDLLEEKELMELYEKYPSNNITGKRNKIIIGLLIYQGLDSGEISRLKTDDIKLSEGKINIQGRRKRNARELNLEGKQIISLQKYITEIRPLIVEETKKKSDRLILSTGASHQLNNSLKNLLKQLKKINPKIKNSLQIRMSVISEWLKKHDIRTVQYMCGHRFVSSTQRYKDDDLKSLQQQIEKIHPLEKE